MALKVVAIAAIATAALTGSSLGSTRSGKGEGSAGPPTWTRSSSSFSRSARISSTVGLVGTLTRFGHEFAVRLAQAVLTREGACSYAVVWKS
ncbi:hypothetical protein [Streptomyces sp. NBC_01438]|uniref:hypothetical protein n=1 Tax=Streptomyces sp. NBC_01438 TaxID=2903866 RepID=UPI00324DE1EB